MEKICCYLLLLNHNSQFPELFHQMGESIPKLTDGSGHRISLTLEKNQAFIEPVAAQVLFFSDGSQIGSDDQKLIPPLRTQQYSRVKMRYKTWNQY